MPTYFHDTFPEVRVILLFNFYSICLKNLLERKSQELSYNKNNDKYFKFVVKKKLKVIYNEMKTLAFFVVYYVKCLLYIMTSSINRVGL